MPGTSSKPGRAQRGPTPGMQRQHHRQPRGEHPQRIHQAGRGRRRVHVRGSMERRHRVALGHAQARPHRRRVEAVEMRQQGVDHGVADEVHPVGVDALVGEVVEAFRAGHEQQVREDVRDPAVDLLRHRHVEAAQAGLDVRHGDEQLGAHERRRERRVHVAIDDDQAGRWATNSSSSAASSAPVWWPWLPEPTPRLTSGDGSDRSRKKTSDSSGS